MSGPVGLVARDEAYDSPTVQSMVAAVQLEYAARYGSPDDAPIDATEFVEPNGLFLVGYLDGVAVAMAGLRHRGPGEAEIKRMYVVPAARGQGLSRQMLTALEDRARRRGVRRLVLETGLRQPEAISLYTSSGYVRIPGFGHYEGSPLSRSFAKTLASEQPASG